MGAILYIVHVGCYSYLNDPTSFLT